MKIVVLGARGLLGQALCRVLPGEVIALSHAEADLTKPAELRARLKEIGPRHIYNAAGFSNVDRAETEPRVAAVVNGLAMRDLATICNELDSTLIHISTNYVFGADSPRVTPYDESDKPGPISRYGRTKLDGEMFVRSIAKKYFIVRTCGLYTRTADEATRIDFVRLVLKKAAAGEPIRVVNDQTVTPTSADEFAKALVALLHSDKYGLFHLTNTGSCTWHEFAQAIFAIKGISADLTAVSSAEFKAPAMRPRYSVLSCGHWTECGLTPLQPWKEALGARLSGDVA